MRVGEVAWLMGVVLKARGTRFEVRVSRLWSTSWVTLVDGTVLGGVPSEVHQNRHSNSNRAWW